MEAMRESWTDDRMDDLLQIYQTMLAFCGAAMAALIGFIATQI